MTCPILLYGSEVWGCENLMYISFNLNTCILKCKTILLLMIVHCVIHALLGINLITSSNAGFSQILERNIDQEDAIFVLTFSSLHIFYSQQISLCLQKFVILLKYSKSLLVTQLYFVVVLFLLLLFFNDSICLLY